MNVVAKNTCWLLGNWFDDNFVTKFLTPNFFLLECVHIVQENIFNVGFWARNPRFGELSSNQFPRKDWTYDKIYEISVYFFHKFIISPEIYVPKNINLQEQILDTSCKLTFLGYISRLMIKFLKKIYRNFINFIISLEIYVPRNINLQEQILDSVKNLFLQINIFRDTYFRTYDKIYEKNIPKFHKFYHRSQICDTI